MRILLLLPLLAASLSLAEGVMVCYFGSWAVYRQGLGKFDVEDIDPKICTHAIFGFAGLSSDSSIRVLDPWNELCDNYGKCAYDRFTALKQQNANMKAILAVGGWNEGSAKYSTMAADPARRNKFITSSIALLKKHGFDGLDMDWEYPTQRGGNPEDYDNFVILLAELKAALSAEGMILTAAVSAGKGTIDPAYNIPEMSKSLDLINVMTYDMHGAWDDYTHHQSGLYAHPLDEGDNLYFNVDFAIRYWIEKGARPDQMALGIPLYGRCWTLASQQDTGYYAPAHQPGAAGDWTRSPGMLGYNEICYMQSTQDWTVVNDPAMNEPYTYYFPMNNIWCSYDHEASVITKAKYAKDMGLAGTMVWSVETDDFRGLCHSRTFNLIKTMVEAFGGGTITEPPTLPPQSTTTRDPSLPTVPPTTTTTYKPPPPGEHCSQPGLNPDPIDCTHYYLCSISVTGGYDELEQVCPEGTLYNPQSFICDWRDSVCHLGDVCPNDC
ncbi:chitinase-3-like protein 1 [Penaeus vannamei]|uniref:chitinase-3-like protein 1 n=1 Tax=Penaeus vannamei TaxID=6689 RepID=UPI00387FA50E